MIIKNAKFITSVADMSTYPTEITNEITFVGRSNVGKSSLINMLAGQKSLARTSSTPGRTRLINIFEFNNGEFYLADLPGYGYQAGSKSDSEKWAKTIEVFLEFRMSLKHAFFLLDIRHNPTQNDINMSKYLNYLRIPFSVVATKADKINKSQLRKYMQNLDSFIGVGIDNIIPVSTINGIGKDKLLERIERSLKVDSGQS